MAAGFWDLLALVLGWKTSSAPQSWPGGAAWERTGPGTATCARKQDDAGGAAWYKAGPGSATVARRES